ncbi:ComEC/Rec2 family competence protein [Seonamhaeicola sp. ML3]|uniref:ComEC/Rec2 family competence protein n=1 Tax=Seonamhaeicola sp. ML3 TaxID=2937786 RepID=UPI002010B5A0|nr:ComEC/Rec2 family competence protein [Seonamhaeicola sp. ML3]
MRLLNFSIIKLTICLIVGIAVGYFINLSVNLSLLITLLLILLLLISYTVAKKQFIQTPWFGLLSLLTMISIGVLTVNLHNEQNFSNHYSTEISSSPDSSRTITFRIRETLKPGAYHNKYVVDILKIDTIEVTGKSLLNIEKAPLHPYLQIDDIYVTKTEFSNIAAPLNPGQFDYKSYLKKKYIYHQLYLKNESLFLINSEVHTLLGVANTLRNFINTKLKSFSFKPDELAIINALFLGQRQDISEDVYRSYANAGAIHILAVSGLHVGIILIFLSFVLKPIERFKNGHVLKTILLLILLWSFAIIAGLSASVTRAVTMFSIVAIAMNLKRPTNIYNTLAISILVILLFKPLFIFDVGFQLSYFAVLAIVSIDPLLYKVWRPKNWLLDKYWHTLTVTISAQLGIIPLSLFYFHQFPGLFFISNLVIIPLLGIILGFGILVIILAILNLLPQILANVFGNIIEIMNRFVNWVSNQKMFLFEDVSFSIFYTIASYLVIIALVQLFIKRNYKRLKLFLITILIFQLSILIIKFKSPDNQFVIFHKSRNTLVANIKDNKIIVAHDFDSITKSKNNIVKNFSVKNHINTIETHSIKPIYQFNNKIFLVVDSLGIYNLKSMKPDYVFLRQSPKINLNRLIDSIKPKQIIADGSNYKSFVNSWESICEKRKLPFHNTSKNGAFIIDY